MLIDYIHSPFFYILFFFEKAYVVLIRPASILTIVLWLSPFEGLIPILFMPSPEEILLWVDRVTPLVLLIRGLSSTHGYRRHTLRPGGREGCMWGQLLPIHQRRVRLSNMIRRKSDWYQKKAIVNWDLFFGLFSCALESNSHIIKERATRHRVGLLR